MRVSWKLKNRSYTIFKDTITEIEISKSNAAFRIQQWTLVSKLKATQHFLPGNEHADVHPWMSSSENDNGVDIPVYYPYP